MDSKQDGKGKHICPWWLCFTFDNPLRKLLQDPERILDGMVQPGQTAIDIGCGMGYFSLPLARMVGPQGKVICVDLQKQMLESVRRRAKKAGISDMMTFQQCSTVSLGVTDSADFVLAFAMVHEVSDQSGLLTEIKSLLNAGGRFLIAEPRLHVREAAFRDTVARAERMGFKVLSRPRIPLSNSVLLGI